MDPYKLGYSQFRYWPPEETVMADCMDGDGKTWRQELRKSGNTVEPVWWRPVKTADELWFDLVEARKN